MKKNQFKRLKVLLAVKFTVLFLCLSLVQVSASVYSQKKKLSVNLKSVSVEEVFRLLEEESDFRFFFQNSQLDLERKVDLKVNDENVETILSELFKDSKNTYKVFDGNLVVISVKSEAAAMSAQQSVVTITGKVIDASGEGIPGVNVSIKGTTTGTITSIDGTYSLDVENPDAILIYSFIGYETVELSIAGKKELNVTLLEDMQGLDEVVVVGYGTQKKVNLTGSVSTVSNKELVKRPVSNTAQALQGMNSGVTIVDRGGAPGREEVAFQVRGMGTWNNGGPLVLVDGVEQSMSNVDPNDIESISVLKDASSAAIYGNRAANGVIIVTTKRGKQGAIKMEYNGYAGIQTAANLPKMVGPGDYFNLVNEALVNAGEDPKYSDEYIQNTIKGTDPLLYPYHNYVEDLFGTGFMHNHSLRFSGGNDMASISVSMNYQDQDGIIDDVNAKRYNFRVNSDLYVSKKLTCSFDIYFNRKDRNYPLRMDNAIGNAYSMGPNIVPKYEDGLYGVGQGNQSPVADIEKGGDASRQDEDGVYTGKLKYDAFDWLSATGSFTYKNGSYRLKDHSPGYDLYDPDNLEGDPVQEWDSYVYEERWNTSNSEAQFYLNFNKTFGVHTISGVAGYSEIRNERHKFYGQRNELVKDYLTDLDGAIGPMEEAILGGWHDDWALQSYFGRVNYNFKEKYLFEFNIRRDGSSLFADGNRWGTFPSLSAGWRLSEEEFIKNISFISNLKLRGSWGQIGNHSVDPYKYATFFYGGDNFRYEFGNNVNEGWAPDFDNYGNPELTWETTEITDIGIDLGFFDNKLEIIADWYVKNTNDVMLRKDIPWAVGANKSWVNDGIVENKGWDLTINHRNKIGQVGYFIGLNLSDVKNKVVEFSDKEGWVSGDINIVREGDPLWAYYGLEADGLFQSEAEINDPNTPLHPNHSTYKPGDIRYKDQNGDGEINDEDRVVMGSNLPRYTFGINLGFDYKNFDFSCLFQGVGKVDAYLNAGAIMQGPSREMFTVESALDRWTPDNRDASYPRIEARSNKNSVMANSFWIQDASYIRLKNLQIGYKLPKKWLEGTGIEKVRFYAGGTNLLTFTNLPDGWDPETNNVWGSAYFYPPVSLYCLGVMVNF
ncbi:SusC/RagA family TonB-linked outer membrane protein [Marinilabiliaceae bacterium JC017]|nr:SusC/RagA family TonB-linked outer membrane protein [Marinilabiliaceae bacterium JC017]